MAAIREQITRELGVEPIMINSALVSAQSRQRLYWTNIPGVDQPEDRGILLQDFLESGEAIREKGYTLKANYANATAVNGVDGNHFPAPMAMEPIRIGTIESDAKNEDFDSQQYRVYSPDGKAATLCGQGGGVGAKTGLYATPIRVGDMPNAAGEISGSQSGRIHSIDGKGVPLQARPNGGGADGAATGLYAIPADIAWRGREDGSNYEVRDDQKANTVTADGHQSRMVIEGASPMRVQEATKLGYTEIATGECVDLAVENSKTRRGRRMAEKSNCLTTSCTFYLYCGTTQRPIYQAKEGFITIKGKRYPIKLRDGYYIIRKLTVTECKRLQTVPEEYIFPVSDTQAYKMLGNGWTVDVIAHILGHIPGIAEKQIEVLSMYDGMACGRIALDKLGGHVIKYWATEIDKYAIKTATQNYPEIIQLGDAFQVREDTWSL